MKKILTKLHTEQKGMALLITLGFLAIGSITIVSLINLTHTGTKAGVTYDETIRLE
ncbi:MAG: hypothetical protein GX631_07570 [Dehalococcoidales bacterium]|nr:hypothetical protein [Dehalococcoidales bacterium]